MIFGKSEEYTVSLFSLLDRYNLLDDNELETLRVIISESECYRLKAENILLKGKLDKIEKTIKETI